MKCPESCVEAVLRDVIDFLETTLSAEALSPTALEQKLKLLTKVTSICGRSTKTSQESGLGLECYIDMQSDPALTSFFGSKTNSPIGSEPKSLVTVSDNMYEPFEDPQTPKESNVSSNTSKSYNTTPESQPEEVCYANTNLVEDNVSLHSAFSEISVLTTTETSSEITISMTAQEALSKNLVSGSLKRRSGVKLVSVWRRHFAVLIPNYLMLYANDNDPKPKLVISLDGYEVRTSSKVGLDTKRLRLHPFHLVGPGKLTHEFAAKTKDDVNQWLTALQTAIECFAKPENPTYDVPSDCAAVNHNMVIEVVQVHPEPAEPLIIRNPDHQSMRARRLPSLPGEENYDDVGPPIPVNPTNEPCFSVHIRNDEKTYEYINPSPIPFDYESEEDEGKDVEEDIYNSIIDDNRNHACITFAQSSLRVSPCKSTEKIQPHHVRSRSDGLSDSSMSLRSDGPQSVRHSTSSESNRQSNHSVESVTYDTPIHALKPSAARRVWLNREMNQNVPATYDVPSCNRPLTGIVNVVAPELYDDVPNPKPFTSSPEKTVPATCVVRNTPARTNVNKIATFMQRKSATDDIKTDKPAVKDITWSKTWGKSMGKSFAAKLRNEPKLITSAGPVVMQALDRLKQCSSNNNLVAPDVPQEGLPSEAANQNATPKKGPPRPPGPFLTKSQQALTSNSSSKVSLCIANVKSSPEVIHCDQVYEEIETSPAKTVVTITNTTNGSRNSGKEEMPGNDWWKTRWAYVAQNPFEISVHAGERVLVLNKGQILWNVRARGKEGLMPKEYLISCAPASPNLTLTLTDDFSNVDV